VIISPALVVGSGHGGAAGAGSTGLVDGSAGFGTGGRGLVVRLARGTGVTERGRAGSAGGGAGSLGEVTV
jgi:hypothetical protein